MLMLRSTVQFFTVYQFLVLRFTVLSFTVPSAQLYCTQFYSANFSVFKFTEGGSRWDGFGGTMLSESSVTVLQKRNETTKQQSRYLTNSANFEMSSSLGMSRYPVKKNEFSSNAEEATNSIIIHTII